MVLTECQPGFSRFKMKTADYNGTVIERFKSKQPAIRRITNFNNYYECLEELNTGRFGNVYRCRERLTDIYFAAKYVPIKSTKDVCMVQQEIAIMKQLNHSRIVDLHSSVETPRCYILIMEIVEGGDLFDRAADDDFVLTEKAAANVVRQICEAVEYIHGENIIHLDVKPENILCVTKDCSKVKLADFGLAQYYDPKRKLTVIAGTAEFVAPEVISFEEIDFRTDMWSIGVITYTLLSGLSPFLGDTDLQTYVNVTKGFWDFDDECFLNITDEAKDFISRLIVYRKEKRMNAQQALSHEWLDRHRRKSCIRLPKENLKRYTIRRRWKKAVHAIRATLRMGWHYRHDCE